LTHAASSLPATKGVDLAASLPEGGVERSGKTLKGKRGDNKDKQQIRTGLAV
jgi:hypothetical protein